MTLPALDEKIAFGVKGPKYKVSARCSNPGCSRFSDHAHHIFRRGYLVDDYDWVEVDGWVVGNLTGLCFRCHNDVTGDVGGHKAAIRLDMSDRTFWWCVVGDEHGTVSYHPAGLLAPQPPTLDTLAERAADESGSAETCPTCGHVERVRRPSAGAEGRRRASWTVKVPDDEREHGAEVLDSLIEALAPHVPSGDVSATGRYYVLVPALAYASMEIGRFVETMKGVGG